ncbi:MAG TPA: DUF2723 domain-containing protein [Gemmatimonadaceae bacterium]
MAASRSTSARASTTLRPANATAPSASRASGAASIAPDYQPSYLAAGITALAILALYVATLSPSTAMWDTSEYIAAAYVLGLPHPPGNPLFVLIAHAFGLIPFFASYAERINLLAAVTSAASAGIWFLITERVLVGWLPQRWQRIVGGVLGAVIGATAFTVWNQSVVNEKVYTVSLLFIAVVSWLAIRWLDRPDGPKADRTLVLIAYLIGLGYTVHPAGFLTVPAVGLAVILRRPQTILRWRFLLVALAALVLGLTPFAVEPIRAAHFPAMNEGEPTGCAMKIGFSCTFSRLTYDRLMENINRTQYGKPPLMQRQASFADQIGMWWFYFKWQWLRDAHGQLPVTQTVLAVVFLLLGLLGGYEHFTRDRPGFWYFGALVFTLTLALIYYLNFKLGYSQAIQAGLGFDPATTEVRDRDYFFLWSFSAWGIWAALGLVSIWRSLADLLVGSKARGAAALASMRTRSALVASPVLALALVPLVANWHAASRAGQVFTRDWAVDILNSVEPYAILITNGDNDTFPLWYAQQVEGVRKDVLVGVTTYLGIDWFARQMIRNPVATYDAAKGPSIYRGKTWTKPSGPPLKMTFAESDAIPPGVVLHEPQHFQHGDISLTVPAGLLTRDQIITLRLITDAFPERPVYFVAGGYGESLGLTPYLLDQGLVQKLEPHPVATTPETPVTTGGGHVDIARTAALWDSVYTGPKSLIAQGDWIDAASKASAINYEFVGAMLAEGLSRQGKMKEANAVAQTVTRIGQAAGLEPLFRGPVGERSESVSQ